MAINIPLALHIDSKTSTPGMYLPNYDSTHILPIMHVCGNFVIYLWLGRDLRIPSLKVITDQITDNFGVKWLSGFYVRIFVCIIADMYLLSSQG